MADFPLSIIIPNWNGKAFLQACLDSIYQQTYKNFETIVIDSDSADKSVEFVKTNYPLVTTVSLITDDGPASAINKAVRQAKGKYLLILNNDVILDDKQMLDILLEEISKNEKVVLNPVELTFNREYFGEGCHENWVAPYLYKFARSAVESKEGFPFYPCTACCICARTVLTENPLDEDIWMYEDVEWGWRLLLRGIKTATTNRTYYLHKNSGSESEAYSPKQAFFVGRSTAATAFMCLSFGYLVLLLPIFAVNYLRHMARYLKRGKRTSAYQYSRGYFEFLRAFRVFNRKRRVIQRERMLGDAEVVRIMLGSYAFALRKRASWKGQVFKF